MGLASCCSSTSILKVSLADRSYASMLPGLPDGTIHMVTGNEHS